MSFDIQGSLIFEQKCNEYEQVLPASLTRVTANSDGSIDVFCKQEPIFVDRKNGHTPTLTHVGRIDHVTLQPDMVKAIVEWDTKRRNT